jgi:hypothetical protein
MKANKAWQLLLVLLLITLTGCQLLGSDSWPTYAYTAYDSTGAVVVTGTMTLRFSAPKQGTHETDVDGTWAFHSVLPGDTRGNQTGRGELKGMVNADSSFLIDTHPGFADNNFLLHGAPLFEGIHSFEGSWEQIGFVGVVESGTFKATEN